MVKRIRDGTETVFLKSQYLNSRAMKYEVERDVVLMDEE